MSFVTIFFIDCFFANLLLEFHTKSPPKGHVVTRYGNLSQYVLVNSRSYFSWKFGIQYDKTISIVLYSKFIYNDDSRLKEI